MGRSCIAIVVLSMGMAIVACTKAVVPPARPRAELAAELCRAVEKDEIARVQPLLKEGADPNEVSERGWTAVHWAARTKDSRALRVLLENGGSVNARDSKGTVPIVTAAAHKRLKNMEMLIEFGAKVDTTEQDMAVNLLLMAMIFNNEDMARLLLKHGANPFRPNDKSSALLSAITQAKIPFVKLFLDSPLAAQEIDTPLPSGHTALMMAAVLGDEVLAALLLDAGADPLAFVRKTGESALHIAAQRNCVEVVGLLLERGVSRVLPAPDGDTPLHSAAGGNAIEALELLLTPENVDVTDSEGNTPLHLAVMLDAKDCAKLLLAKGANPNLRNQRQDAAGHRPHRGNEAAFRLRSAGPQHRPARGPEQRLFPRNAVRCSCSFPS